MSPASLMIDDMREQPAALRALVDDDSAIAEAAALIRARAPSVIKIVGHGSSDNATSFGFYALSISAGIPVIRDSLSLGLYYEVDDGLADCVVVAMSQSGETPDVVAYATSAAERGTLTVAVTNEAGSALARVTDAVIPILAGPERSLPATKTYMNQLASIFLLAAHLAGTENKARANLRIIADAVEETLQTLEPAASELAVGLSAVDRMFVVARGIEFATARETALKLTESCRIVAAAMTTTAFCHGPVAAVDESVPVWAIVSDEATLAAARDAATRVTTSGGKLVVVGSRAQALPGAYRVLPTPAAPEALLGPLLSIIPGQLVSAALARVKDINPDVPTDVFRKVTRVS